MTEVFLLGERLKVPPLRFNPSSLQAQCQDARRGLKTYGPYDASRLGKENVRCTLIYLPSLQCEKQKLVDGLINGNGAFSGFKSLFRIPLEFVVEREIRPGRVGDVIKDTIRNDEPDIVIAITPSGDEKIYTDIKALLLAHGIPSQVVTAETLRNRQGLPWILENIALQIYAKIGGTPWTVMSYPQRRELVVGVSRAMDREKNYVVGFIILFTHDGDYQFMYSLAPKPVEWNKLEVYREELMSLILDAYEEYEHKVGKPSSIIIHLCKRPGRFREVAAVEKAIQEIGHDLPYALLHLNDDTNYRLFDTTHPTYVPLSGIKVEINPNTALLLLDGRAPDQMGQETRKKRGVPRVLEVSMDKRSTLPIEEFPRLIQQVFEFARVNWRGFNAQAIPATLNYSYLVARLVGEIGADNWSYIVSAGRLRDKAWFL